MQTDMSDDNVARVMQIMSDGADAMYRAHEALLAGHFVESTMWLIKALRASDSAADLFATLGKQEERSNMEDLSRGCRYALEALKTGNIRKAREILGVA